MGVYQTPCKHCGNVFSYFSAGPQICGHCMKINEDTKILVEHSSIEENLKYWRWHFAGLAMKYFIKELGIPRSQLDEQEISQRSVFLADTLIKELEKK